MSSKIKTENNKLHQGFGNYEDYTEDAPDFKSGNVLLKTRTDKFKEHWCMIQGNEIYCFRSKQDYE